MPSPNRSHQEQSVVTHASVSQIQWTFTGTIVSNNAIVLGSRPCLQFKYFGEVSGFMSQAGLPHITARIKPSSPNNSARCPMVPTLRKSVILSQGFRAHGSKFYIAVSNRIFQCLHHLPPGERRIFIFVTTAVESHALNRQGRLELLCVLLPTVQESPMSADSTQWSRSRVDRSLLAPRLQVCDE